MWEPAVRAGSGLGSSPHASPDLSTSMYLPMSPLAVQTLCIPLGSTSLLGFGK